jgi:hypothetical protein
LRRFMSFAAAVMLAAGLVVSSSSVASATRAECEGGANGFVDIPDSLVGAVGDSTSNSTHDLYLMFGSVQGRNRGWSYLRAAPGLRLGDKDLVWMDWSTDGGAHWLQCGPFPTIWGNISVTSAAKDTHSSYRFRAGALVSGQLLLTDWI